MKRFLFRLVSKRLLGMLSEEDILAVDPKSGKARIGSREISREELDDLAEDAKAIMKSPAFALVYRAMIDAARKKIFDEGHDRLSLDQGKMVLWALDVMAKKIANMASMKR